MVRLWATTSFTTKCIQTEAISSTDCGKEKNYSAKSLHVGNFPKLSKLQNRDFLGVKSY